MGLSAKKRPTRSFWLPTPAFITSLEASSSRAFSIAPQASTVIARLHGEAGCRARGWRHRDDRRAWRRGARRMPVTLACSSGVMLRRALQVVAHSDGRNRSAGRCRASWRTGTSWYRRRRRPAAAAAPLRGHARRRLVIEPGSGLDQRLGAGEIGLERGAGERPAGMGHPVARLEIDRVQRPAPAAPMIGAAAQKAQPSRIQRGIAHAALARRAYSFWILGSKFMPPDSSSRMSWPLSASASAREMPAGPPPMMARSGVSTVPAGSVRASRKAVKREVRGKRRI